MAKERVQVQGLGGAVPGIQPTIQRAGQYAVAQLRAAPVPVPRSKLLDLADTLKAGQDVLQQYGLAAKQEAEIFEDELSRKSPEEIQAMLKETEGELDKQVRRGAMGWLTSPLNQKRKLRAVGQASSKLMMEQVYNRLENPEAGDEDLSTREVINLVQQNFVGGNEGLSGSVFAQEGLQQAINPQILPLARQYDAQKSRVAKGDTAFGTTNVFYELAKDGSNLGEYDEETTQALLGSWENLSAFSANEQRDILGKVFENLSKNGMEEKADSLLLWASKNIKIGASKMTELEYDGYSTMIERTAEVAGNLEEKNRADKVEDQTAKYRIAHNDIQRTGSGTYNGQEYTDLVSLQQAAEQAPEFDDDVRGKADLQKQIDGIVKSDVDPVTMYVNEIYRNPFAQGAIRGGIQEIDRVFNATLSSSEFDTELALSDPEVLRIKSEFDAQFQETLNQELRRISHLPEGRDPMRASQLVAEFITTEKERISREMDRKVQIRLDKLSERAERTNTRVTESTKAPERSIFDDEQDELENTIQANNVILNREADVKERKAALKFFRDVNLNNLSNIASGTAVKGSAVTFYGMGASKTYIPTYSKKEQDQALQNYMQGAALSTEFTKQEVLDNGVTSHGVRFDIKQIDPDRVRLLTDEEIAEVKDITDLKSTNKTFLKVKELAKKLGADDVFEVITKQQRLLKALADL
jgi:hypothetical protein